MDVFIASNANTLAITSYNNANPLNLQKRTLFFLGTPTDTKTTSGRAAGTTLTSLTDKPSPSIPKLVVTMDSYVNTIYITIINGTSPESVYIENVPMNIPFRLGIVVSPFALEGYLNGLLVMTRQLRASTVQPAAADLIYAPSNILYTPPYAAPPATTTPTFSLAEGISVMNLRTFGYQVTPAEMTARMYDLVSPSVINPPPK